MFSIKYWAPFIFLVYITIFAEFFSVIWLSYCHWKEKMLCLCDILSVCWYNTDIPGAEFHPAPHTTVMGILGLIISPPSLYLATRM